MSDCINWTRSLDSRGYGHYRDPQTKKTARAHRRAWQEVHGKIPEGLCVLHRCDNRKCINIEHLFLGTQLENMADMARKGRRKGIGTGATNGRAKLTAEQVEEIRKFPKGAVITARIFGVSKAQIRRIRIGEQWAKPTPIVT